MGIIILGDGRHMDRFANGGASSPGAGSAGGDHDQGGGGEAVRETQVGAAGTVGGAAHLAVV